MIRAGLRYPGAAEGTAAANTEGAAGYPASRFGVLGPVEIRSEGGRYVPRGPKVRKIFALMLLGPNQAVSLDTMAEELWDDAPPRSAVTTIRTHVYHLRGMLERESGLPSVASSLLTNETGYQMAVTPGQLDADAFARLLGQGRELLAGGRSAEAAAVLRRALSLWRGPVLANVRCGRVLSRLVLPLEEMRVRGLEMLIEADMRLGHHRELVSQLRGLVATDPLNEWFHARLIDALHRSGRRSAALTAFRDLRRLLNEELGVEPSAEVQRLQHEILTAGGPVPAARRQAATLSAGSGQQAAARQPVAAVS
jgi:SARP family transcriptional regulator, regulator of embCAB operon